MIRAGMPLLALMKLLGHRTPHITMRYVHVGAADLCKAYDHALGQIHLLHRLPTPNLPVASPTTPPDSVHDVPQLFDALITQLESFRRDATTSARSQQLQRFIKRIRKARDDLKKTL
jgi:hypothetical protein